MAFFSQIEAFSYLLKMHGTPNFLFGYQEHLLSLHSFKPGKIIPVLVGTTHRKPEHLEMRRRYAQ